MAPMGISRVCWWLVLIMTALTILSFLLSRVWLTRELTNGHLSSTNEQFYLNVFILCAPHPVRPPQKKMLLRLDHNYNLHLHLGRGVAATVLSIVLEGQEEYRWRQFFLGTIIVDDHFNSLEIVAEEKFDFWNPSPTTVIQHHWMPRIVLVIICQQLGYGRSFF